MAPLSRRCAAAALVALPFCWTGTRAQAVPSRRPTPAQTEGPFYPVRIPDDADADLLHNGRLTYARGQPAWVEGVVSDLQGKPLSGAQVEIWQCDEQGHYHHPGDGDRADPAFQGSGRVTVGAAGRYRFRTLRPVRYSGRTAHIHFKVKLERRELLTTQLWCKAIRTTNATSSGATWAPSGRWSRCRSGQAATGCGPTFPSSFAPDARMRG